MHKYFFIPLILTSLVLSGCQKVNMDELAEDNLYHYKNKDFKFSIDLPPEFIYYQTQRITRSDYTDVEFYVPTNDTGYSTKVSGYALAVTVRIFSANKWQETISGQLDGGSYEWLSENKDRVYTIKFWNPAPADWQERWSEEMRQGIKNSFRLN
jgi:hypothetical protein